MKLMLERVSNSVRRRSKSVNNILERWFISSRGKVRAPRLYYFLINPSLQREQHAVMAGRLQFDKSKTAAGKTNSLLRRNIHRLEKGLIMRPRRDVFALDYIGETYNRYLKEWDQIQKTKGEISSEFEWFTDVLNSYFQVTGSHPVIDPLRKKFAEIDLDVIRNRQESKRVPYRQAVRANSSISYSDFISLCTQRKSVRWFLDRPVPRDEILKVLEAARYSPSACNRYPFFFHVFDEKQKVEIVSKLPGGTVGFAENFPVIIAIIGELRNYYGERDRHLIYVDASLAAMSAVLAAETLGLATCCINWPDIEEHEKRADQVLGLEPDQRPVMFMALGYPDPEGMVAYSQKKPITEICNFNSDLGISSP